jgi:hypothetical protein
MIPVLSLITPTPETPTTPLELGPWRTYNTVYNSLPEYQLFRLQSLCNELYKTTNGNNRSVPFWIDTLGIPVQEEYRKLALSQMASTFSLGKPIKS